MDQATNNPAIPNQNPQETVNTSVTDTGQPQVYKAVRAVGVVRPTYQPQNKIFGNNLQVIGTAFWLKNYKVLVTCAHVVQGLLAGPLEQTGLLVVGNLGKYARAAITSFDRSRTLFNNHSFSTIRSISRTVESPQMFKMKAAPAIGIPRPTIGNTIPTRNSFLNLSIDTPIAHPR